MSGGRGPKHATAGEAAAVTAVYEKVSDLLNTLRDARMRVHHQALLAIIDQQIDVQLGAEDAIRKALAEYADKTVVDPY